MAGHKRRINRLIVLVYLPRHFIFCCCLIFVFHRGRSGSRAANLISCVEHLRYKQQERRQAERPGPALTAARGENVQILHVLAVLPASHVASISMEFLVGLRL